MQLQVLQKLRKPIKPFSHQSLQNNKINYKTPHSTISYSLYSFFTTIQHHSFIFYIINSHFKSDIKLVHKKIDTHYTNHHLSTYVYSSLNQKDKGSNM